MACRVGMSRYPHTRIQEWKDDEGHNYGKVLAEKLTYDQALAMEKREAKERGCHASPGGARTNTKDWAVYYVSGGKIR